MLKLYGYQELLYRAENSSGIACFGAGKRLTLVEQKFAGTVFADQVKWIVDNDKAKQGQEILLFGKSYVIMSPDEMKKTVAPDGMIFVTCDRYQEILAQLDSYEEVRDIDWICLFYLSLVMQEEEALAKKIPVESKKSEVPLIPKKIHYFWFGGNPIPDRYQRWMESWHRLCPDYEIIQWNEKNYDITKNDYMRQAYENKKWGFVPDYARIDVVYTHGGIYLDTDVELIQNLDDLLYQKGFAGFEAGNIVTFGSGFGAVKGLEILKEMMQDYENQQFVKEDGSLNLVPSPFYQTKVLEANGLIRNGEYQVVKDMTIYPEKLLCGKCMATMRVRTTPYTHAIHHYDGSWAKEEDREYNRRLSEIMNRE